MSPENFPITIYHNPACGTSRNTVAMVRAAGYDPVEIDYMRTGWTKDLLRDLAHRAGLTMRELMRENGTPAATLGLLAEDVTEDALLDAMVLHPILVNRPLVVTPLGVRLCRPSERVLDLLAVTPTTFAKEDGEVVVRPTPEDADQGR